MTADLDPRVVQTLAADLTAETAHAIADLVAEAGLDSGAIARLLAQDFLEAWHGESIADQVSGLHWAVADGTLIPGTGVIGDDSDLTAEEFTAATRERPWEYLLAAAEHVMEATS